MSLTIIYILEIQDTSRPFPTHNLDLQLFSKFWPVLGGIFTEFTVFEVVPDYHKTYGLILVATVVTL